MGQTKGKYSICVWKGMDMTVLVLLTHCVARCSVVTILSFYFICLAGWASTRRHWRHDSSEGHDIGEMTLWWLRNVWLCLYVQLDAEALTCFIHVYSRNRSWRDLESTRSFTSLLWIYRRTRRSLWVLCSVSICLCVLMCVCVSWNTVWWYLLAYLLVHTCGL